MADDLKVGDSVFLKSDVERMKRKFRGDEKGFAEAATRLRAYQVKSVDGSGTAVAEHGTSRAVAITAGDVVKAAKKAKPKTRAAAED